MKRFKLILLVISGVILALVMSACGNDDLHGDSSNSDVHENYCKHDNPSNIIFFEAEMPTCQKSGLSEGKKCTICGTMVVPQHVLEKGECFDYELIEDGTYAVSSSSLCTCEDLIIPETYNGIPITSIRKMGFYGNERIKSITISDSVTSIGQNAFRQCTSLESVDISDSVTSIGEYAFEECTSLKSIDIPDSVTSIGKYAFSHCASLERIKLSNALTSIEDCTFECCTSLTNITIPNSVINIGSFAFQVCSSLQSITIPNSVTNIGAYIFESCLVLKDIIFQGTIEQWKNVKKTFIGGYVTVNEVVCFGGTVPWIQSDY